MRVDMTTRYPGGHAKDPGYRWVRLIAADGRHYNVHCDVDGGNVRSIQARKPGGNWRALSAKQAAATVPVIEPVVRAFLAHYSDPVQS